VSTTGAYAQAALAVVEEKRDQDRETALEAELSVNEWVSRVRGATMTAHSSARAGSVQLEINSWAEVAAAALGRIEFLLGIDSDAAGA
jgi:hypothetical protein